MKKYHIYFIVFILIYLVTAPVHAHRGRTDANGGHYDNDTGEYHYHHGYSAHKHIDGVCPYNHDDQTKHQEGTSSASDATKKPELHLETPDPHPAVIITPTPHTTIYNTVHHAKPFYFAIPDGLFQALYILVIILLCCVLYRLLVLLYNLTHTADTKEINQLYIQEATEQSSITELPPKAIHKYPDGYGIDENELPYKLNRVYGWGNEFNVFVTQNGHCYHRNNCKALKGKGKKHILLHRYVALKNHYDRCRFCQPKSYVDEWYIEQLPDSPYAKFSKSTIK